MLFLQICQTVAAFNIYTHILLNVITLPGGFWHKWDVWQFVVCLTAIQKDCVKQYEACSRSDKRGKPGDYSPEAQGQLEENGKYGRKNNCILDVIIIL